MEDVSDRPSINKLALVVIGYHLVAFCTIQILLHQFHGRWINSDSLVRWDAVHYQWIAEHGYVSFRQAFFPLFPFLWKLTTLDASGISLLNAVLYLCCMTILAWQLRVEVRSILLWMVFPSAIFFFVPYSESVFFAGALVVILGVRAKSRSWAATGLFICALSRPAFTTLLPSLLLVAYITNSDRRGFFKEAAAYILISAFGVFLVSSIQHHFTNDWWGFYTAQQVWGNRLRPPVLPLSSWGGQPVTDLDAVALLAGALSLVYLGRILWFSNSSKTYIVEPEVLLSCGCIASISVLTLLFRGGALFSLNRFVFVTPFALVLIDHARKTCKPPSLKRYIQIFIFLLAYFLLFGAYVHIQAFLKFTVLSIYLLQFLAVLTDQHQKRTWLFGIWLVIAFGIQCYFAVSFLNKGWVA